MVNPFEVLIAQNSETFELLKRIEHLLQKQPIDQENIPGQASPPYVSKREAARMLSCSQGTIDNFARAGKLKRSYLGKSVRFERAQVLGLTRSHHNSKQ